MIGERPETTSNKTMSRNLIFIPSDGKTWETESVILQSS